MHTTPTPTPDPTRTLPPTPTPTSSVTPTNTPGASITPTPSNTPTQPLTDPHVIIGSDDSSVRRVIPSGLNSWKVVDVDNSSVVTAVTVDDLGNVYSAKSNKVITKLDSSGTEVWAYTEIDDVFDIAVDSNYNVINASSSGDIRKLDSSGIEVWVYKFGENANNLSVDSSGNVLFSAPDTNLRMLNSTGTLEWMYTLHNSENLATAFDYTGNAYSAGLDGILHKISPDGTRIWRYNAGAPITSVAIDNHNRIYISLNSGIIQRVTHRGIQDRTKKLTPLPIKNVSIDVNYNMYFSDGNVVRKLSRDWNDVIWSKKENRVAINTIATSPLSGAFIQHWGR